MAEAPLKDAIKGKDVEIEWMPFELRPYPAETVSLKDPRYRQGWEQSIKPMAERFGVKMNMPKVDPSPHTHLAHEGFRFAKETGKGNEYVEAVLRAYWEDGKDIGKIDVLADIAESAGVDRNGIVEALKERRYEPHHKQALRHAYYEASITAVPTFFIGRRRVQGLHTKESLEKIINEETAANES
ncbi:DsbA family oxidoreductase [Bacillus sp. M6-12]|uniref:DsbA family oxidoreductase n=1 Tax=Bacillus sp. M6-12 TaxID=2054166 RepID=UPI0021551CB3|nr:DsbA family protein [Bacillus sp. M6-12]